MWVNTRRKEEEKDGEQIQVSTLKDLHTSGFYFVEFKQVKYEGRNLIGSPSLQMYFKSGRYVFKTGSNSIILIPPVTIKRLNLDFTWCLCRSQEFHCFKSGFLQPADYMQWKLNLASLGVQWENAHFMLLSCGRNTQEGAASYFSFENQLEWQSSTSHRIKPHLHSFDPDFNPSLHQNLVIYFCCFLPPRFVLICLLEVNKPLKGWVWFTYILLTSP